MKRFIMIVLAILLLTGCAGVEKRPSVCDGIDVDSLICDKLPVSPETADVLLQLADYEILKRGVFKKQDVSDFFDDVELLLDNATTWADLIYYVTTRVEAVNKVVGSEILIVSQYADVLNSPLPISEFDKGLLRIHIERQRKVLALYMADIAR